MVVDAIVAVALALALVLVVLLVVVLAAVIVAAIIIVSVVVIVVTACHSYAGTALLLLLLLLLLLPILLHLPACPKRRLTGTCSKNSCEARTKLQAQPFTCISGRSSRTSWEHLNGHWSTLVVQLFPPCPSACL